MIFETHDGGVVHLNCVYKIIVDNGNVYFYICNRDNDYIIHKAKDQNEGLFLRKRIYEKMGILNSALLLNYE